MANILVVEDSADARLLMRDLLERLEHQVSEADNGLAGVRMALNSRPDLILLDLMMPAASGGSTLRFIRGTPGLADIPVLVISAHPDVAQIARNNGADAWVSKPVSIAELSAKIDSMLKKRADPPA